jgi:predicted phage gp36 major capsid-like protein
LLAQPPNRGTWSALGRREEAPHPGGYSNELLSHSAADVAEFVAGEIAYAFAAKEDDCGYNGDGTSGVGGIAGLATNCRPDEKHGALWSRAAA